MSIPISVWWYTPSGKIASMIHHVAKGGVVKKEKVKYFDLIFYMIESVQAKFPATILCRKFSKTGTPEQLNHNLNRIYELQTEQG